MAGVGLNKDVIALFMLEDVQIHTQILADSSILPLQPCTLCQEQLYVRNSTVFDSFVVLMVSFQTLRKIEFLYDVFSQFHCV